VAVRVDPVVSRWEATRSGGRRRMAVLSEGDARRYSRLAGRAASAVELATHPAVVANRVRFGRRGRSLIPLGPSLRAARSRAAALARRWPYLLRTDVASFYPSVDPAVAYRALVDRSVGGTIAAETADLLEGWGSEGYPGLPVGPPGSAVVANAILDPVDRALCGFPFLRWVDDYLIGVETVSRTGAALERLDHALDGLGLRRSERKTRLWPSSAGVVWPGGQASGLLGVP
jgi:hypothetical protein